MLAEGTKIIPKDIQEQFPQEIIKVFSIDLDQDENADYIITFDSIFKTCYMDSKFKIRSCDTRGNADGFVYYYFAQLDNDSMLELFEFQGDEDYSDYKLLKLDPKTWKTSVLFKISPWITTADNRNNEIFWGYPWDIDGIELKKDGDNILLPVSLDVMGTDIDVEKYPNIFFTGVPTQNYKAENPDMVIKKLQHLTLNKITTLSITH